MRTYMKKPSANIVAFIVSRYENVYVFSPISTLNRSYREKVCCCLYLPFCGGRRKLVFLLSFCSEKEWELLCSCNGRKLSYFDRLIIFGVFSLNISLLEYFSGYLYNLYFSMLFS